MKKISSKLLDKAQRSIQAAEKLLQTNEYEFSSSRSYYAMFYVAEALLHEKDLKFKRHGSVHGAFGKHFVKAGKFDQKFHRWMLEAFNRRLLSDYSAEMLMTEEDAAAMIPQAQEFLATAREYLS